MQASVHRYDETSGAAVLVTDDAQCFDVAPEVLARAGLRTLRVGQRLDFALDEDGAITSAGIPGLQPWAHIQRDARRPEEGERASRM